MVSMFRDHYNHPARSTLMRLTNSSARSKARADPETKRKTIGRLFIEVFEDEAKKTGRRRFSRPGHALPGRDRERVSFSGGPSVTIKSHHNVGGLPDAHEDATGRTLARAVQGRSPGKSAARARPPRPKFVGRHPFPGPGLAIRLPGGVTRDKLDILQKR